MNFNKPSSDQEKTSFYDPDDNDCELTPLSTTN